MISIDVYFSSHQIFIHMLQILPNTYHPWPYNTTPLFNLSNGGMPFVMTYANFYQQTRAVHPTGSSYQKIMTSSNFSSHQTLILNTSQQKKILKHYQEHSEFILFLIPPFNHQRHQKYMSNVLLTCTMTMDLNLLSQLYAPWVPNLEYLDPKLNTLWYPFS